MLISCITMPSCGKSVLCLTSHSLHFKNLLPCQCTAQGHAQYSSIERLYVDVGLIIFFGAKATLKGYSTDYTHEGQLAHHEKCYSA